MNEERIGELEKALRDRNLWNLQDCDNLMGPGEDRPAGGDTSWRRWPEPSPLWYAEALGRAYLRRN